MTIFEFISEELDRIARFGIFWKNEHDVNPEQYPVDMEPSDWDEALMTFSE